MIDTKELRRICEAAQHYSGSLSAWLWVGEAMASQYTPSLAAYFTAAIENLHALLDELDAARAEIERLKASLREVHEKLDIGERNFPDSPCAIFSTLLEIHDLGKDAAKDTQP